MLGTMLLGFYPIGTDVSWILHVTMNMPLPFLFKSNLCVQYLLAQLGRAAVTAYTIFQKIITKEQKCNLA